MVLHLQVRISQHMYAAFDTDVCEKCFNMSDSWPDWLQQKMYWHSASTNRQVYSNNPKRVTPSHVPANTLNFDGSWPYAYSLVAVIPCRQVHREQTELLPPYLE
jgi:hypothetical protein